MKAKSRSHSQRDQLSKDSFPTGTGSPHHSCPALSPFIPSTNARYLLHPRQCYRGTPVTTTVCMCNAVPTTNVSMPPGFLFSLCHCELSVWVPSYKDCGSPNNPKPEVRCSHGMRFSSLFLGIERICYM